MFTDLANSLSRYFYRQSVGLLFLRLATGLIFLVHGATKLGDMAHVVGFFGTLGLGVWIAWFIALLETIGGAALILGVATRVFGALFAIEMLVILFVLGIGGIFTSHQFEFLLFAASLAISLAGSGGWSLYPMECLACGGVLCDGQKCTFIEEEA